MKKVEHIGLAVKDMSASNKLFTKILGVPPYKTEKVDSEGVITSFFQIGDNKIELISSIKEDSPIEKYLSNNRQGIHHIAFTVEDIQQEILRFKKEGIRLLNDIPKKGADNKVVCFLHPKDTNGVLIEICQEAK